MPGFWPDAVCASIQSETLGRQGSNCAKLIPHAMSPPPQLIYIYGNANLK